MGRRSVGRLVAAVLLGGWLAGWLASWVFVWSVCRFVGGLVEEQPAGLVCQMAGGKLVAGRRPVQSPRVLADPRIRRGLCAGIHDAAELERHELAGELPQNSAAGEGVVSEAGGRQPVDSRLAGSGANGASAPQDKQNTVYQT